MQILSGKEQEYQKYVKMNSKDGYSRAVVDYAERWANMMEEELALGEKLESIARDTSHRADTDGITGFMYGAAVGALAHFWVHGDGLRRWHNGEHGVSEEQAKGKTVNPAVLTIG